MRNDTKNGLKLLAVWVGIWACSLGVAWAAQNIQGILFADGSFKLPEVAAPATPGAAKVEVYAKADGLVYSKDDAGVETLVSGGSGTAQTLAQVLAEGHIAPEGAAPGTPAAANVAFYAKADGLFYSKDDAGAETLMSGGAATVPTLAEVLAVDNTATGSIDFPNGYNASFGGAAALQWLNAQTNPAMSFQAGASSHYFLFIEQGDGGTDFGFATPTDPTIVIQSADQTAVTERAVFDWQGLSFPGGSGAIEAAGTIGIGTDAVAQILTIGELTTRTEVQVDALLVDINAGATGLTLDSAGTISLDAAATSNFTVTGSGNDMSVRSQGSNSVLGFYASGGGAGQEAQITSAGTGVSAVNIDATAGGIDIDAAGAFDMLSAGAFSIDGVGASNLSSTSGTLTVSALTSGDLVLDSAAGSVTIAGSGGAGTFGGTLGVTGLVTVSNSTATGLAMGTGALATPAITFGDVNSGFFGSGSTTYMISDGGYVFGALASSATFYKSVDCLFDVKIRDAGSLILGTGLDTYVQGDGTTAGLAILGTVAGTPDGSLRLANLGQAFVASDVAPQALTMTAGDANGVSATTGTNDEGAPCYAMGGIGAGFVTIIDFTQVGDTITITVDGTPNVFTEVAGAPGANQFNAETSDEVSATNLGASITTADIGVTVTVAADIVYLQPDASVRTLLLAETGVLATTTKGVDGATITQAGTVAEPSLQIGAGGDGLYEVNNYTLGMSINDVRTVAFGNAATTFYKTVVTSGGISMGVADGATFYLGTGAGDVFLSGDESTATLQVGSANDLWDATVKTGKFIAADEVSTPEIDGTGQINLTTTVAAAVFTVTLATLESAGGTIFYTVHCEDATDVQAYSSRMEWTCVAKATTITSNVNSAVTDDSTSVSSGTLAPTGGGTNGWTVVDNGDNTVTFKLNMTTSLTANTFHVNFLIVDNADGTLAPG